MSFSLEGYAAGPTILCRIARFRKFPLSLQNGAVWAECRLQSSVATFCNVDFSKFFSCGDVENTQPGTTLTLGASDDGLAHNDHLVIGAENGGARILTALKLNGVARSFVSDENFFVVDPTDQTEISAESISANLFCGNVADFFEVHVVHNKDAIARDKSNSFFFGPFSRKRAPRRVSESSPNFSTLLSVIGAGWPIAWELTTVDVSNNAAIDRNTHASAVCLLGMRRNSDIVTP